MGCIILKIAVVASLFFLWLVCICFFISCVCIRRVPKPERNCYTCRHYLGGGQCRINLEAECGKGEFEAWEAKEEDHVR